MRECISICVSVRLEDKEIFFSNISPVVLDFLMFLKINTKSSGAIWVSKADVVILLQVRWEAQSGRKCGRPCCQ